MFKKPTAALIDLSIGAVLVGTLGTCPPLNVKKPDSCPFQKSQSS